MSKIKPPPTTGKPKIFDIYRNKARENGFPDGLINLILSETKSEVDRMVYKTNKKPHFYQISDILKGKTKKYITIMKQTDINQKDFLLDVFERFGKNDAQAALDFVRHNLAEQATKEEKTDKNQESTITLVKLVDLGLPSGKLWADRNLGAKSPEDYGAFVSWGNTDLHFPNKDNVDWGDDDEAFDYKFSSEEYRKTPGYKLEGNIDAEHDAATVNLGEPWCMPTEEDIQELYDNCIWTRKTLNGVNGYEVKSKINGNSIFFPCSGNGYGTSWYNRGANGYYWSSSLNSAASGRLLYFCSGGVYPQNDSLRFLGFAVRPVQASLPNNK